MHSFFGAKKKKIKNIEENIKDLCILFCRKYKTYIFVYFYIRILRLLYNLLLLYVEIKSLITSQKG